MGKIKSQYGFNENGEFIGRSSTIIPQVTDSNMGSTKTSQINKFMGMKETYTTLKRMRAPKSFVSGATSEFNSQRYLVFTFD